jgi:hypothetical protein
MANTPTTTNAINNTPMAPTANFSKRVRGMSGLSLHGWENWMVGSLIVAGFFALVAGVATWQVVRLQRIEIAESKIEFEAYKLNAAKETALARKETAEALKQAADAELSLIKFREPRHKLLTAEVLKSITERLKPFAGTKFDVAHIKVDREIWNFMWWLEPAIREAGWVQVDWVGGFTFKKNAWPGNFTYGEMGVIDVSIEIRPAFKETLLPAANALAAALNDIGVKTTTDDDNNSSVTDDAIHFIVGPKR